MSHAQSLSQMVETYRFDDVASLWARERLEHEAIVARALARAIVCDGLRVQSVDSRWANGTLKPMAFNGYPYVGYTARPGSAPSILRASALRHLMAIVERGVKPDLGRLHEEFIERNDFRRWLVRRNLALPRFWYA